MSSQGLRASTATQEKLRKQSHLGRASSMRRRSSQRAVALSLEETIDTAAKSPPAPLLRRVGKGKSLEHELGLVFDGPCIARRTLSFNEFLFHHHGRLGRFRSAFYLRFQPALSFPLGYWKGIYLVVQACFSTRNRCPPATTFRCVPLKMKGFIC